MDATKSGFQDEPSTSNATQLASQDQYYMKPEDIKELHDSINYNEIESVEEIIKKSPFEIYASNDAGQSAVATTLKLVRPSIYELLITNGFRLKPYEDFSEIMDKMSKDVPESEKENKDKIFKIHKKCAIESNDEHLLKVCLKCRLHYTTPIEAESEYFRKIMIALRELNKIPEISILMEIIAICPRLQIIFDFFRESNDHIDPTKNKYVMGSTHPSASCITIGAKLLLDEEYRFEVYGTMAHEFCHYAMNFMFNNDCKPYSVDDEETKMDFEAIVNEYSEREISEEIVQLAFQKENENKWHAELIVRIPHILALYKRDDDKLEELHKEFSVLFRFYDDLMIILRQMIPRVKIELAVEEINENCGLLSQLQRSVYNLNDDAINRFEFDMESKHSQIYKSNCVELTIRSIYEKALKQKKSKFLIFTTVENLKNEKIAKQIFTALESYDNVVVIVNCDKIDEKKSKLIDEIFKKQLKNQKLIFVTNEEIKVAAVECKEVNHLCSELTEKSKEQLLKTKVSFQGTKLELNEIWSKNLESDSDLFDELLKEKEIEIGEEIKFVEFHVERTFDRPGAERVSSDDIIKEVDSSKVFILSDAPGSGKTTELKFLTLKLKQKYKNRWILLIDLKKWKKYTKFFKYIPEDLLAFNSVEKIADFLADEILNLKILERKFFLWMFKNDRVVVLMDGYDEISPSSKELVKELAVGIKKTTNNQFWVAINPNWIQFFESKLNTRAWKLTELSEEDQTVFFKKFFQINDKKYEDFRENIEKLIHEKRFEFKCFFIGKVYEVMKPLFLHMIAQLFIDGKILHDPTFFTVFQKFVNKMFGTLLTKRNEAGNDAKKPKVKNLWLFHKKIAVEKQMSGIKFNHLLKNVPETSNEQLLSVGLINYNGGDDIFFCHETFMNFFVAKIIVDCIFKLHFTSEDEFLEAFDLMKNSQNNVIVIKFVDDALKNFKIPKNSNNEILFRCLKKYGLNLKPYIRLGLNNWIVSLTKLITNTEEAKAIWLKTDSKSNNVLTMAFHMQPLDKIQELWGFADEFFTRDQIKSFLTFYCQSESKQNSCLLAAIQNDDEKVLDFFLMELEKNNLRPEEKENLISFNRFHWEFVCIRKNVNIVLNNFKKISAHQYKIVLKNLVETNFISAFRCQKIKSIIFLCEEIIENFDKSELKNILQRTDKNGCNFMMYAVINRKNPEVCERMIDFIETKNEVRTILRQEDKT